MLDLCCRDLADITPASGELDNTGAAELLLALRALHLTERADHMLFLTERTF